MTGWLPPCHYMALCQLIGHPKWGAAQYALTYRGADTPVSSFSSASLWWLLPVHRGGSAWLFRVYNPHSGNAFCQSSVVHQCVNGHFGDAISALCSTSSCWGCGGRRALPEALPGCAHLFLSVSSQLSTIQRLCCSVLSLIFPVCSAGAEWLTRGTSRYSSVTLGRQCSFASWYVWVHFFIFYKCQF